MKIYQEEKEEKKSWAIRLNNSSLLAVDSITGEKICSIIVFGTHYGEIWNQNDVKHRLQKEGYDPFEHGNKFTDRGSIIIKNTHIDAT